MSQTGRPMADSAAMPGPKPAVLPTPETPLGVGVAPEPAYRSPSVRASLVFLVVLVILGGVAYPAAVVGFADLVAPNNISGTILHGANGTAIASELIGQNITNNSLFWLRPSLSDYTVTTSSGETPYGPTDPNLRNLTLYYIGLYGLNGSTVPIDLVTPSESGFDPGLTPAAVLVQIPRVAAHTNLTQAFLTSFVKDRVVPPLLGFLGPAYVNVISLDIDLIKLVASGTI